MREQRVGFEEPALFYLSVSLGEGRTASYPLSYSFSYERRLRLIYRFHS